MHRGHWTCEFVHFHNFGSHFQILADETAPGITAINRIHHPPPGAIPLDHFTYGTTGVPGELPKTDGTGFARIGKHPHLYQRRADPHRHARETLGSPGASSYETSPAPPQNQPGQMPINAINKYPN